MTPATDSPMEGLNIHRRLGRYELLRRIALSSTAEVHLARPVEGGERVAIKRLLPHALEDPEQRARFTREIEAAMSQTHPGLARGLEVVDGRPGEPCLVMTYVEGPTLAELLTDGRGVAPQGALVHAAIALATSMEALHGGRGGARVHGDISARNVVARGDGAFTLLDLGSSAGEGAEAMDAGTPRYVCPERRGGGPLTTRGDVYSAGVLLWELTMGRRWPIDGPPAATSTDTHLGALIERCLSETPDARPANASALRALLGEPGPDTREAWLRWTGATTEVVTPQVSATQGALAWVALIGALTVATATAAWFIAQVG